MMCVVRSDIRIKDITPAFLAEVEQRLIFDNPEYYRKQRLGKWTGNCPQKLYLYERRGEWTIIPFGMLPFVFAHRSEFEEIQGSFSCTEFGHDYKSTIKPYDYQQQAIEAALKARQGVIVAPCGSGKTMIGLEVAARLGGRCLWLTHTADLLNQSMLRAQEYLGLSEEDYGTITGGKVDIGKAVTFATVQTMANLELDKYANNWDVVIVDECHHVVGTPTRITLFYRVIGSLAARYKFGLTATPKRTDGLLGTMFALIGPKVFEISQKDIEDKLCPVTVKLVDTGWTPNFDEVLNPDGTLSVVKLINSVTGADQRNARIIQDVANHVEDGPALVLTDRVAHVNVLVNALLARGINAFRLGICTSKAQKEARNRALVNLNKGKIDVIVATYALAREGLDVPNLRSLFLATPQKNETIVTQATGRVGRKAEGKNCGVVYDYCDGSGLLASWLKKRMTLYKRLGYNVIKE